MGLPLGISLWGSSSCAGLQRSYLGTDPPSDLDLSGYNIKVNMLGVEFKQGCQDINHFDFLKIMSEMWP